MVDHLLVLFLDLVAELDDSMNHSSSSLRHIFSQIVQLLLKRGNVAMNVGCEGRQLGADRTDELC